MLVMCVVCEKWSHGLCYRILDTDSVPETHTCAKCPGLDLIIALITLYIYLTYVIKLSFELF